MINVMYICTVVDKYFQYPTTIDATTQSGYTNDKPVIELTNSNHGIAFNEQSSGSKLFGCYITGNYGPGISIDNVDNITIGKPGGRNVISNNCFGNIVIGTSNNDIIQNNYIGTDISGLMANTNPNFVLSGYPSVDLEASSGVIIGGTGSDERNVISGDNLNSQDGI